MSMLEKRKKELESFNLKLHDLLEGKNKLEKEIKTLEQELKYVFNLEDDTIQVVYRGTVIVEFDDEKIILNTNGYKTNSTRLHMNETSAAYNLGYKIEGSGKNPNWNIHYKGEIIPFHFESVKRLDR